MALLTAVVLTASEIGQASLAILVALIGYLLHRKANHIEVLVNGRMTEAMTEIDVLQARIGVFEAKLGLASGEPIPSAAVVTQLSESEDPTGSDQPPTTGGAS